MRTGTIGRLLVVDHHEVVVVARKVAPLGHLPGHHDADVRHQGPDLLLQVAHVHAHLQDGSIQQLALAKVILGAGARALALRLRIHPHQVRGGRGLPDVAQEGPQVIGRHFLLAHQHGHLLGDVAELAHVAGPAVGLEELRRVLRQLLPGGAVLLGELMEERLEDGQDVLRALPQAGGCR
jgi:hypothetical protein